MSQQGLPQAAGAQQMGMNAANAAQQEEAKRKSEQQQRDMRNAVLSQCLDQDARARLNTLALAKPDKATQVEDMIIRMRQTGQIFGKLTEKQFVEVLERVAGKQESKVKVNFDRRRVNLDDDDDY